MEGVGSGVGWFGTVHGPMLTSSAAADAAAAASRLDSESQRVDGKLFKPVVRQVHRRQIGEARKRVGRQFRDDIEVGPNLKCGEGESAQSGRKGGGKRG